MLHGDNAMGQIGNLDFLRFTESSNFNRIICEALCFNRESGKRLLHVCQHYWVKMEKEIP